MLPKLSDALKIQLTLKHLPRLDEDTRIVPLLDNLSQGFLAGISSEWSSAPEAVGDEVTADMIDGLARKHFPMCMRHLHESLRRDKHLKHHGRLQYGLFLKVRTAVVNTVVIFDLNIILGPRPLNRRGHHFLAPFVQYDAGRQVQ